MTASLRFLVLLAAAVAVSLAMATVRAASPVFWRVSTQGDFLQGEADNVSVDASGRILLGPDIETIYETDAPFVWSLVTAADAVWLGSGDDGMVSRVGPNGDARPLLTVDARSVYALTPNGEGGVYAGTAPDGEVVAIDSDGTTRSVFDPEEPYIWALAAADDGTLFVGTGNPGRIYRIAPNPAGNAVLWYDTGATHVRSLAIDDTGRLVAGTSAPGQVFRIDDDGEAFVLLDSSYDEITAIRPMAGGALLAVAASGAGAGASAVLPSNRGAAATATVTTSTNGGTGTNPAPPAAAAVGNQGAVYRIAADGIWDLLWDSDDDTPYDAMLSVESDDIIIATGPNGKLFRVSADAATTILLTRVPAQQITRLAATPGRQMYYATANPGTVARLIADRAREGTYLSEVHDAGTVATWGAIRWQASTPGDSEVEVVTRSGNTATPGDTWSRWSDPYPDSTGSAITSPKARYVQWRASLRGRTETPALRSVSTAYLPRNLAPDVTDVTVHDAGQVFQQAFASGDPPIAGLDLTRDLPAPGGAGVDGDVPATTLGRQVYRKGLRTFVWTARDLNRDELRFDVLYRLDDTPEGEWRPLTRNTATTIFTWDTTSVPDGTYIVRIVASDGISNAPDERLTGARETGPVVIDNTPPRIVVAPTAPTGAAVTVSFAVSDTHSPIERVEYTIDTRQWQIVYPVDGIPDSRAERFMVTVPGPQVERLVIRATDAMDNIATTGVVAP